jgi:hypothetical protein
MQGVKLCDRQMCLYCQLCLIAEGTDCYYILYMLTVTVYITLLQVHSQTLHTNTHTHTCMQILLSLNLLFLSCNKKRARNLPLISFPQFSPTKGSPCNRTISLRSYSGSYVNRRFIVYQQLHCAVFSKLLVNSSCPLSRAMELLKMIV